MPASRSSGWSPSPGERQPWENDRRRDRLPHRNLIGWLVFGGRGAGFLAGLLEQEGERFFGADVARDAVVRPILLQLGAQRGDRFAALASDSGHLAGHFVLGCGDDLAL